MDVIRGSSVAETEASNYIVPKLLIFVNPKSGSGTAVTTFNSKIRLFLAEAHISYELIITEFPGHCKKVVQETPNLKAYQGIVAVSGDGLLYEVFNSIA